MAEDTQPPLLLIRGDASAEEIAALVAVLQAVAAAGTGTAPAPAPAEWSAHHRRVRRSHELPGSRRGGWRSSSLPR